MVAAVYGAGGCCIGQGLLSSKLVALQVVQRLERVNTSLADRGLTQHQLTHDSPSTNRHMWKLQICVQVAASHQRRPHCAELFS